MDGVDDVGAMDGMEVAREVGDEVGGTSIVLHLQTAPHRPFLVRHQGALLDGILPLGILLVEHSLVLQMLPFGADPSLPVVQHVVMVPTFMYRP